VEGTGERRVMVHSANGHRPRKGGNGGAPPDLYTTALALHSTPLGNRTRVPGAACFSRVAFFSVLNSALKLR